MTRWFAVYWPPYALVPVRVTRVYGGGNLYLWVVHVFGVRVAQWTGS